MRNYQYYVEASKKSENDDLLNAFLDGALQSARMFGNGCPVEGEFAQRTWITGELMLYEAKTESRMRECARLIIAKYGVKKPEFRAMVFGHGDANGDGGAANESSETLNHCVLHEIGSSLDHLCKCVDIIKDMLEPCEPSETIPPERK